MYDSRRAASEIRSRVSGRADTVGSPLSTRDTVETVTPAASATSISRGLAPVALGRTVALSRLDDGFFWLTVADRNGGRSRAVTGGLGLGGGPAQHERAAVDVQHLPGDIGRLVAGEEDGGPGQLRCLAQAADRDPAQQRLRPVSRAEHVPQHVRGDVARR